MPSEPGGPDCEGLIHKVSDQPIPEQPPFPSGVQLIELSWSRTRAMMRFRLPESADPSQEWYFKEMNGEAQPVGADPKSGRMLWRAKVLLQHNGGHPKIQMWRPRV